MVTRNRHEHQCLKVFLLFLIVGNVTPLMLQTKTAPPPSSSTSDPSLQTPTSRRQWFQNAAASVFVSSTVITVPNPARAIDSEASSVPSSSERNELPSFLRDYTNLAPLGKQQVFDDKTTGLSLSELAQRLANDLTNGAHGQGGYFLTGDLSTDIFRDDCLFEDPTNRVASLSQYKKALTVLFDPERSIIEIISPLVINEAEGTICGRLRSRGYLKLPWNPYISSYETTIRYTVDPESGLIARQDQTWSKSASEALKETFTPTLVAPPPKSTRLARSDEPAAVSKLFDALNGRRPNEYSPQERTEIDALIDEIVQRSSRQQSSGASSSSTLSGKWILAYLQPGPDGAGIDRRIPFPDFDFNENYQVFSIDGDTNAAVGHATRGRVTNIGQLLGPFVNVQVAGTLEASSASSSPFQRYEANIDGGKMCFTSSEPGINCWIDLPMIQGKGLFDSLYLGDRLRIGQNLNGGGARVVQLRLSQETGGQRVNQ